MKFDFCIGNPPYQESRSDTKDMPVYHYFMDAAYSVADKVELIHPARFLFNAGATPKDWNQKMLEDEHFKILDYQSNSRIVFPANDIKGGVTVSYRDKNKNFGSLGIFTTFPELNSILEKVVDSQFISLAGIIYSASVYRITDKLGQDFPVEFAKLKESAKHFFASNVFDVLSSKIFFSNKPEDGKDYLRLYGRMKNERVYRYVLRKYVGCPDNVDKWKVLVPAANGCGALGEIIPTPIVGYPVVGYPFVGHTQTFISIGRFSTERKAEACLKYVKTKFARCMLGILKITQHNPPEKWKYVPLQDFTVKSDIDWSKSVHEIDLQLYQKYGLDEKEIKFIEEKVKEMK